MVAMPSQTFTLPNKYIGDTIEFILRIGVDMTGQINSNNPGGILLKDDNSAYVNMNYTVIDISSGEFRLYFDTSSLTAGRYKLQMWWSYTDSSGMHTITTPIYNQNIENRLSAP